jgi:hypothetical protein
MISDDLRSVAGLLKLQVLHYEKLLDDAFNQNTELAETKLIYTELKKIKTKQNWKKLAGRKIDSSESSLYERQSIEGHTEIVLLCRMHQF